jgi:hypothetical protein
MKDDVLDPVVRQMSKVATASKCDMASSGERCEMVRPGVLRTHERSRDLLKPHGLTPQQITFSRNLEPFLLSVLPLVLNIYVVRELPEAASGSSEDGADALTQKGIA